MTDTPRIAHQITGLILAGGRGSRMGHVDKGLQPFRGSTLVAHILQRLAPQVASVAISANRNREHYAALGGAAVLADQFGDYQGPLAGLHAGLRYCPTALLLTVPCDAPCLPRDLARRLHAALQAAGADIAMAVTLETDAGGVQRRQRHPVFSLLKTGTLPALEHYLASGERRMHDWLQTQNMVEVVFEQADAFHNLNTLDQLQRLDQERDQEPAQESAQEPAQEAVQTLARQPAAPASAAPAEGLPVAEAQRLIQAAVCPLATEESVPLRAALGRVLARDLISPINVPAYDNSAMDGYALDGSVLPGADGAALSLEVIGVAYAGRPYTQAVAPGNCVRIMTGAPIPAGCDSVLPQELAMLEHDRIGIAPGALRRGDNRRCAGEDLQAGGVALAQGKVLRPADLGLIASLGISSVSVRRRLRVAYFSTGDELRSLGETLDTGCVYDSNRYTLFGMLTRLGVEIIDLGIVRDQPEALEAALRSACSQADAILTSGGVSVGAADYTRTIMARLGDVAFWSLAMRPGRPLAFGQVRHEGDSAWLFGLPGNPVAVMVSFYFFARPALLRLMGATPGQHSAPLLRARSQATIRKRPGRTEYQRAILDHDADGAPQVRLTGAQGSGILRSMSEANCIVVLHASQGNIAAGELVDIIPFDGLI